MRNENKLQTSNVSKAKFEILMFVLKLFPFFPLSGGRNCLRISTWLSLPLIKSVKQNFMTKPY